MASNLLPLFRQKSWINRELYGSLQALDAPLKASLLPKAIRTLNHIRVVEGIFQGHLSGKSHGFQSTNTDPLPGLDELQFANAELDAWYETYAEKVSSRELSEEISFEFTDGDRGRMTREEMLLHVLAHSSYHRGQVGQMIKDAGLPPSRDLFTRFLHSTEPQRRR
jgi:uncharacterized damage-inducible protein DinB